MTHRSAATPLMLVAALLACAGCASRPRSAGDQAAIAACRTRADEVYVKQNRGDLFRSDTAGSAPFAGTGLTSSPVTGLSSLHQRDDMLSDCVRQSTAQPAISDAAAVGPAAAPSGGAGLSAP